MVVRNKYCNFEYMKLKSFLLGIVSFFVSSINAQYLSNDSLIKLFTTKFNEYRLSLSLSNVVPEQKYKTFVNRHSLYQARMNDITHGEGQFSFENRYYAEPSLSDLDCQENCTMVVLDNPNDLNYLASQVLKHFKESPGHNKSLVNPKFKKFGLSCYKKDRYVYVTLLVTE